VGRWGWGKWNHQTLSPQNFIQRESDDDDYEGERKSLVKVKGSRRLRRIKIFVHINTSFTAWDLNLEYAGFNLRILLSNFLNPTAYPGNSDNLNQFSYSITF
jgi:hypothetical protein